MNERSDHDNRMDLSASAKEGAEAPVESPCIGVCVLDMADVCEGCYRTAEEITQWVSLSDAAKRRVVELTWQRARAANKLL